MYIGNQPVLQTSEFREEFIATAGQTVFNTLGFAYSTDSAFVEIFRNGVLLGTEDYTLGTDGTTVTLSDACSLNDIVLIKGRRAITQGVSITESRTEYTWQSGDTYVQLNADIVPGYADVYLNGVKLPSAEFSIDTGTKRVTFTTTPSIGDEVSVVYRTETSSLVALPLKDSAGNTILSESGGTVTLENASLGDTVLMPDNSNNVSTAPGIRFEADTDTGIGLASAGNLAVVTGGSERLRVDSSGNVGIGTTSPIFGLVVSNGGANGFEVDPSSSSGTETRLVSFNRSSIAFSPLASNASQHYWLTSGTERMRIDSSGSVKMPAVYSDTVTGRDLYVSSTGQLGYVSSIRNAKINISNLELVNWFYSLNPVTFQYRTKDEEDNYTDIPEEQIEYGLIAEEVETINSDLVFYDETENGLELRGVQYSRLIAPIIKAVQQQKELIESQQSQIDALTARIQALEV